MFLLTTKSKHHESSLLFRVFENAVAAAREYVGEHNEVDGCSTPRREHLRGTEHFTCSRSSSFGSREAQVQPITDPQD